MEQITKKPWFGPKRYVGWGISPRSWQGWLVMVVFIALLLLDVILLKNFRTIEIIVGLILIMMVIVISVITGNGLGGPGKKKG